LRKQPLVCREDDDQCHRDRQAHEATAGSPLPG
jgi:hypothetical protein